MASGARLDWGDPLPLSRVPNLHISNPDFNPHDIRSVTDSESALPFSDEEINAESVSDFLHICWPLCTATLTLHALFRLLKRVSIQNYPVVVFLYFISMSIPLPK